MSCVKPSGLDLQGYNFNIARRPSQPNLHEKPRKPTINLRQKLGILLRLLTSH